MKQLEKNVYFDDVKTVYWTKVEGCDPITLFITKEDAIEFTNKYIAECSEYMTKEEMKRYCLDGDAEDYIEEIELDPKEERAATNEYGTVILERLRFGKWEEWVD